MGHSIQSCLGLLRKWSSPAPNLPAGYVSELAKCLRRHQPLEALTAFDHEVRTVADHILSTNPNHGEYQDHSTEFRDAESLWSKLEPEFEAYLKLAKQVAEDPDALKQISRQGVMGQGHTTQAQAEAARGTTESFEGQTERERRTLLLGHASGSVRFPILSIKGIYWIRIVAYEGFGSGFELAPGFLGTPVFGCFKEAIAAVYRHAMNLEGIDTATPRLFLWWVEDHPDQQEPLQGNSAGGAFLNAIAALLMPEAARPDGRVVVSTTVTKVMDGSPYFGVVYSLQGTEINEQKPQGGNAPVAEQGPTKKKFVKGKIDCFLEQIEQDRGKGHEFDSLVLCREQIRDTAAYLHSKQISEDTLQCFDLVEAETGKRHSAIELVQG